MDRRLIRDIFYVIQGHQITEEDIYNSFGDVPIYTGKNSLIGYVETSIVDKENLPCISYPTKGGVGNFYVKEEIFEANNTGVLILKEEWREKINLYWLISKISKKVKEMYNSKNGIGYIGKELMESIVIDIPDKNIQNEIGEFYRKILVCEMKIELLRKEIDEELNSFKIKYPVVKKEKISEVCDIFGGNIGLTEEFIYNNSTTILGNNKDMINVYSGSTSEETSLGKIPENVILNKKEIKIFNSDSIIIIRKGQAGKMNIIKDRKFTINDDAYVLIINDKYKNKINLEWFVFEFQDLFYNVSSAKEGNSTFNKTYCLQQDIEFPDITIQNKISKQIKKIKSFMNYLNILEKEIEIIKEKEFI